MPELLLELFSEEIPARMQVRGAEDLARLLGEALAPLAPRDVRRFSGPRRIAVAAEVATGVTESRQSERGPRVAAPAQALAGFLRKHGAMREQLREEGAFWVLDRAVPGMDAAALIARELPGVLRRFPWPKSMRWGGSSAFTWVRPLRRILCILDGEVVRFDLRQGEDDGHGLASDALSEGHRFLAPGAFGVSSAAQWQAELRTRYVIADAAERRAAVEDGIARAASAQGLSVVPDAGLLDEVTGLVEWPVPLLGRIDAAFMDLPPEVMQVSMRVNQRYFALRDAAGEAAPWFAFAANVAADDGGAAIVAGNERVLRARFSDARHFWNLDRRVRLEDRVAALDAITFHAKLGSQGDRVRRLVRIAGEIARLVGANVAQAQRAALLAKADLTTGMVGEFPELQGVMGRYYARHDGEDRAVADAVCDHYLPRSAGDTVARKPVAVCVALADKLDQLVSFFRAGEKPTGSGDPYALRRAALGLLRTIDTLAAMAKIALVEVVRTAEHAHSCSSSLVESDVLAFLEERWRVHLRASGHRYDIVTASFSKYNGSLWDLNARIHMWESCLTSPGAQNVVAIHHRLASILEAEEKIDGPHRGYVDASLLQDPAEQALYRALSAWPSQVALDVSRADYVTAFNRLGHVVTPANDLLDRVTVNSPQRELRSNRLRLVASVVATMDKVGDFSKIEG